MFVLNPQSGTPIYRQLVEQITRLIAGGQLAAGTELPSVRELAELHAINPMTISKAYALLEGSGLLGATARQADARGGATPQPKRRSRSVCSNSSPPSRSSCSLRASSRLARRSYWP